MNHDVAQVLSYLRAGCTVEIEGRRFRNLPGELKPGDLHIAGFNTGPHILTCRMVCWPGWVYSHEHPYPFASYVRVIEIPTESEMHVKV